MPPLRVRPGNGTVLYSAGSPKGADCRGFCGEKMIEQDSRLVKRGWKGRDGGTSKFLSFLV